MKKCWLVFLSLGLVVAFSISTLAADVKFSGSFEIGGVYLDKTSFIKGVAGEGPSSALYFQKLRVRTDFIVAPGLTLVTRFDAMERAWGATRSAPGTTLATQSAGTVAENENIAFSKPPCNDCRVQHRHDGFLLLGNKFLRRHLADV